jgi:DNA invertase Pin-like site-specific DNA recombinase
MTIAYIRTYSNKQQTESQKNAIEQFAKAKKIEIDKWLKDAKNSSKEKNRLEDVIKNLQEGDILIVADVTRLSRKLMEIMHLILLCIEKKVALYCIKEGYSFEDNVNSKTLAFTFGLVSEIESKLISARTKEALTASKNKGTKLGRPLGSPKTEFLLSQKSQIERELKEENATYAELADYYKVSLIRYT